MTTKIATNIAVDDPVPQTAALRTDRSDRRYIDDQILAIERHIVDSLLSSTHCTWFRLSGSSTAVIEGDCVCLSAVVASDGFQIVTKAVAAALSDAKSVTGVVIKSAAPGNLILVAISGTLPASITGLGNLAGAVRVNTTTARCEQVSVVAGADYPVGTVNSAGALTITPTLSPSLQDFISTDAVYTIDASSSTPSAGKVVALKNGSANEKLLVVAVAGAFQGGPLGVLPVTHTAGDTNVAIAIGGTLPNSITGLGNSTDGKPHDVTWDLITGSLQYLYRPSGGELIIGHSPGDGRLTVVPTTQNDLTAIRTLNPKQFGAYWDDIHNDTAAWVAMMNAIPKNGTGYRIELPPGRGYLAGVPVSNQGIYAKVPIKRYVHISGHGGGSNPSALSGIRLAMLTQMVFDAVATSDDGGGSANSEVEHVDLLAKTPVLSDGFGGSTYNCLSASTDSRPNTSSSAQFVEVGTVVVYSGTTVTGSGTSKTDITLGGQSHTEVCFRCTTSGTLAQGSSEPAGFATATTAQLDPANGSHTIADSGGVVWTCEGLPKDLRASTAYTKGQRWWNPGDRRYIFECTVGGTTDTAPNQAANPYYIQPEIGKTFTDGTCTVKTILASKVTGFTTSCKWRHSTFKGGFGPDFYFESGAVNDSISVFTEFCDVENIESYYSGGLAHLHGNDANGISVKDSRFYGCSTQQTTSKDTRVGTGEIPIWDRSQDGGRFSNCYAQFGKSPGYICDNAGGSGTRAASPSPTSGGSNAQFSKCESENLYDDILYYPAMKIGTSARLEQSDSTAVILRAGRARGLQGTETDPASKITNYNIQQLLGYTRSYSLQAGADITYNAWHGWNTDRSNTALIKSGIFAFGSIPQVISGTPMVAFGVTNFDCRNTSGGTGPGVDMLYLFDGYLNRDDNTFHGTSSTSLTTPRIRYGLRNVNDTYPHPSATGAVGTWRRCCITTSGYEGVKWSAGLTYIAEHDTPGASQYQEAILVIPSTAPLLPDGSTRVWKYTGSLTNDGVEPIWPGSGDFTDAHGNTWVDMGVRCVAKPTDFIDGNVVGRIPQTRTLRKDTASTDSGTAAAKSELASFVIQAQTTTNAANQTIATLDSALFDSSGALPDNAVYHVDIMIQAKTPAGHTEAGSCRISADYYRDGGALTFIGAATTIANYLGGTTNALAVSSNTLLVQASPGVNTPVNHTVTGTVSKRLD